MRHGEHVRVNGDVYGIDRHTWRGGGVDADDDVARLEMEEDGSNT